jgi:hypothetical protein
MNQILDGCDSSSSNPMNWKFGGSNVLGSYTYSISPKRTNRPFPPPTAPKQSCKSWYKLVLDAYDIYGAGVNHPLLFLNITTEGNCAKLSLVGILGLGPTVSPSQLNFMLRSWYHQLEFPVLR